MDAAIDSLTIMLLPLRDIAHACTDWGAQVESAAIRVQTGRVIKADVQVERSHRMHVDVSVMNYGELALAKNRVTLRGLVASCCGPEVCDLSGSEDPLPLLVSGDRLEAVGQQCAAAGRSFTVAGGELVLMDMLTPHAARPLDRTLHRVLVNASLTLQLPDNWRARIAAGDRPQARLG